MRDYDVERDSQDLSDSQSIWDTQSLKASLDTTDTDGVTDTESIRNTGRSKSIGRSRRAGRTRNTGVITDSGVKKRAWVKTVAIIFLAVMLVLTFFSNTIMNRSLPEVAAQYTSSGAITARIRGTGTVLANENFEVKLTGLPRTVSEVPVRVGDEVDIGDLLIKFTGTGTEDLDAAEVALRSLESELEKLQLELSLTDGRVAEANRAVQAARNDLTAAQRDLAGITYSDAAYNSAQAASNTAQTAFNNAQATASARQIDLAVAQAELDPLEEAYFTDPSSVNMVALEAARNKRNAARVASILADGAAASAGATRDAAASAFLIQQNNRTAWQAATAAVRIAQSSLDTANADLTAAQQSANVSNSVDAITLREKRRDVEDQKALVERLRETAGSTSISSLVGGVITAIEVQPGGQAVADEVLMVIEVVDRGYSISFTVPVSQASRVSVGDMAEVDRGWFWRPGEELRATLINIRNDPQNPMANRILRFNITGDVKSGDQLNLILAQRSENYNIIVPNSAIRTDTNGDFVLVVIPRTSPLGNRYIATRADVNILASDDTHTAVTGALTGWDFVITTSSAPIDPGMQVRLVDNP